MVKYSHSHKHPKIKTEVSLLPNQGRAPLTFGIVPVRSETGVVTSVWNSSETQDNKVNPYTWNMFPTIPYHYYTSNLS